MVFQGGTDRKNGGIVMVKYDTLFQHTCRNFKISDISQFHEVCCYRIIILNLHNLENSRQNARYENETLSTTVTHMVLHVVLHD